MVRLGVALVLLAAMSTLAGCGFGRNVPTRTPVPTWTATPLGAPPAVPAANQPEQPANQAGFVQPQVILSTPVPTPEPTATPTPIPPTSTPTDTATPAPTATPTDTPQPTVTPTPVFLFDLEAAEKFPTEGLAENVVRIFAYAYSPAGLGLGGYRLQVNHNGALLPVDGVTETGLPAQTREEPGPYTRFTNVNAIFIEPQAGEWTIQLVDENGQAMGPPATFSLTADETTRELYVRYRQK